MAKQHKTSDLLLDDNLEAIKNALIEVRKEYSSLEGQIEKVRTEAKKWIEVSNNSNQSTIQGRETIEKSNQELTKLEKAHKKLQSSYSETGAKLAVLKNIQREQNQINKNTAKLNNNLKDSYNGLSAQYSLNMIKLNKMSKEQRENTKEGKKLVAATKAIREEMKKLQADVGSNTLNVGNYSSALTEANKRALSLATTLGVGLGLRELNAAVQSAVTIYKDFNQQIATLGAISGASEKDLGRLEAEAKRLGETTQFTASQVAELQTNFARVGFEPDQIIAATEATLNLAIATGEDLASASEVAAATLGGYQLQATETQRVTDVMAASFNASALNLEKFRESTKLVAPVATSLNIPIEQTTATLGALADAGLDGTVSGTALRRIFTELGTEGSKLSNKLGVVVNDSDSFSLAMQKLSQENISASDAIDLVGRNAASVFTVMANSTPKIADLANEFNGASDAFDGFGAAAGTASIVGDTLEGDLLRLQSAIEGAAIRFVEANEGGLRSFIQSVTALIPQLQENAGLIMRLSVLLGTLIARHKILVALKNKDSKATAIQTAVTKGYAAAIELMNDKTKRNIVTQKIFSKVLRTNPIGLIVTAVGALVVGLVELYSRNEQARASFDALGLVFKEIFKVLTIIPRMVINLSKQFAIFFKNTVKQNTFLGKIFQRLASIFQFVGNVATKVFNNLPATLTGVAFAIRQLGQNIRNFFENIGLRANIALKQFQRAVSFRGEAKSAIDKEIKALEAKIKDIEKSGKTLGEAFNEGYNSVKITKRNETGEDLKPKTPSLDIPNIESLTEETNESKPVTSRVSNEKTDPLKEAADRKAKALEALKLAYENEKTELLRQYSEKEILENEYNQKLLDEKLIFIEEQQKIHGVGTKEYIALEQEKLNTVINEQKKQADATKQAEKKKYDLALKSFDEQQALEKSKFDLLKKSDAEKEAFTLNAEKERLRKILELNKEFNGLLVGEGEALSTKQVETIENQIAAIDGKIKEASKEKKETPDNIYDLIGIDFGLDDGEKQGVSDAFNFAKGQFNEFMALRAEMAAQAVENSQKEIDSSKLALEAEIEKSKQGLRADIEGAQERLKASEKAQEKALEKQKKIAKAQNRIQTVEQATNLVTASAKIWGALGGIPPLAIAAIATMWGSFTAAKVQASKLTKKKFKKGGVELLGGGTHESGNDTYLGFQSEGKPAFGERGEAVGIVNAKAVNEIGFPTIKTIFNALNSGRIKNNSLELAKSALSLSDKNGGSVVVNNKTDNRGLEKGINQIAENTKTKRFINSRGNEVVQTNNSTTEYVK